MRAAYTADRKPMAKKQSVPSKLQPWLEARQRYHLTDRQIQMARELGLNPKKFGVMPALARNRGSALWVNLSNSCI